MSAPARYPETGELLYVEVRDLADAFTHALHQELTATQMLKVIAANRVESSCDVCHSHDHCDANVVMLRAFQRARGRDPDLDGGRDTALWNEAWSLARSRHFRRG